MEFVMMNNYIEAAEKVLSIAEKCEDEDLAKILTSGSTKIMQLGHMNGMILKVASVEASTEESETK